MTGLDMETQQVADFQPEAFSVPLSDLYRKKWSVTLESV